MEQGTLVHVPSMFNFTTRGSKSHPAFEHVGYDEWRESFSVPCGTPGVFLETVTELGSKWSKVLYPQGIGWVQAYQLQKIA